VSRSSSHPPSNKPQFPEKKIQAWGEGHNVLCETGSKLRSALEILNKAGVTSLQLILLLELLRSYVDLRVFEKRKRNFEKWSGKAKSLARRLRSIAPLATELLGSFDQEFVESLYRTADNIENHPENVAQMTLGDPFGRAFGGTTYSLVFAAELLKEITNRPHYKELADLIACIAAATPGTALQKQQPSEGAIRKAVTHFRDRQPELVENFLQRGQIEKHATDWVREWRSGERRLKKQQKKKQKVARRRQK